MTLLLATSWRLVGLGAGLVLLSVVLPFVLSKIVPGPAADPVDEDAVDP
jgi:hypothetical protein